MCTHFEMWHAQSLKKSPECANDVEADVDWVQKRDISSFFFKSLGLLIDTLVEYPWTDPTSLLLHLDWYLIQFLLSYVQIVILCPIAVVLRSRTMFRALATVRDRTVVLPVMLVKLSSVLPLTSNHAQPKNSLKSHWLGWTSVVRKFWDDENSAEAWFYAGVLLA